MSQHQLSRTTRSLSTKTPDTAKASKSRASLKPPSVDRTGAASPIEIAETQQETSQARHPFVEVPIAPINRDEWESLHSSQINSDGGLKGFSSPTQSQRPPFNYARSRLNESLPESTGLVSISSSSLPQPLVEDPIKSPPSTNKQACEYTPREKRPATGVVSSPLTIRKQPRRHTATPFKYPQPVTLDIPSSEPSSSASKPGEREHVLDNQQHSEQTRKPSQELGSSPARRYLTISELTDGVQSQSQFSQQPNKASQQQNNYHSPPWKFQTQAFDAEKPADLLPIAKSGPRAQTRRLLESISSPIGSMNSSYSFSQRMATSPAPSIGPVQSPPGSTFSPNSSTQMVDRTGNIPADTISGSQLLMRNETDLAGTSPSLYQATDNQKGIPKENVAVPTIMYGNAAQSTMNDVALAGSDLPIQNSIEEEQQSSNGEQSSTDSKASSSQQSVENERDISQAHGWVQPTLPILGPGEYAIALPAEGKIQSTYFDVIKAKRKAIIKFINRHDSVGSSSGSPNRTHERNEMNELIQRLHDTTTHMDLGLPGLSTQYSIQTQEHAAYANYAGSKFSFLGHLVDMLKQVDCSIIVMSREGAIQDLLEQYLTMKHISVRRHDRIATSKSPAPDRPTPEFHIELISTMSSEQIPISKRPILMIAFDASFDSQDPQVLEIRSHFSNTPSTLLPVIHLLVSNSSEHVDRCLSKNIPSPSRLKMLVRATYQAGPNLGGKPTYVPDPSDEPEDRAMDMSDLQRALRKSPERKLRMLASIVTRASLSSDFEASWSLGLMPELQLTELDDPPPKASGMSSVAETPREVQAHSRTPLSRADTPSGRKRVLEIEGIVPALNKRQRLTPLRDSVEAGNVVVNDLNTQLAKLQELANKLQADLVSEREARKAAEQDRNYAQEQLDHWRKDHADLQRRYEKRMTKCHELEKQHKELLKTIENNTSREERIAEVNSALKKKNTDLQAELDAARAEIKAGGGDTAALEVAREENRRLLAKSNHMEKSLENTRKDFDFVRSQYQEASNKAVEFASRVRELETDIVDLTKLADGQKQRLKETNFEGSVKRHLAKISELELERKAKDVVLRKLEEENRQLKRNRGIQTRGSSVQPPGSPGLDGHGGRGPRSRQGSPAPGLFPGSHVSSVGNRGSLLRHER